MAAPSPNKDGAKDSAPEPQKIAPCQVTIHVEDKVLHGTSVSFSDAGMLVLCRQPVELNTKLRLLLQFPDMKKPIEIWGEVVWTNIHGPDDIITPRGMGVKFTPDDADTPRMLVELSSLYINTTEVSYHCYYT